MTPVDFDGQAGWWHPAASDAAVVICPPIGRDARCAYLPLRHLADRIARAGYAALRFDYPGEGESLDIDPEADALPRWREGVGSAVGFARRNGARRIALAGLRMGATLAAEMAAGLDADALMLLAPVNSGRGWLRELKLRATMAGAAFRDVDPTGFVSDDLRFSQATAESVGGVDLKRLVAVPPRVFMAAQAPATAALAEPLRALGATVEVHGFDGYEALFEETHSNLAPEDLFAEAIDWLRRELPGSPRAPAAPVPRRLEGRGWVEEGVTFGEGLRGVLCRPTAATPRPQALVFLSTGGEPRQGLGRFPVTAGRALAGEGVASLRFDFSGVGDSDGVGGALRSHPFEQPRVAEIAAAADVLSAHGFREAAAVGVCAGAYHAVRAAAAEPRVTGVFGVSALRFAWRPGTSFAIGGHEGEVGATRTYIEGLRDPRNWLRVLKGEVQVRRILISLGDRMARRLFPGPDGREAREAKAGLARFAARGGRARYILGVHDSALDEMERWFGPGGRRLAALPGSSVRVLPGLDHGLSYARSRAAALEELRRFAGLPPREAPLL